MFNAVDCNREITELTPSEAWHCFVQSLDLPQIHTNSQRMWSDFTSTTIGEWLTIIFSFGVMLPTMMASYVLPFYGLSRLWRVAFRKARYRESETQQKQRIAFSYYMILGGVATAALGRGDQFMINQAIWIAVVGVVLGFAGKYLNGENLSQPGVLEKADVDEDAGSDDEKVDEEATLAMSIKAKCQWGAYRARDSQSTSLSEELRQREWNTYLRFREKVFQHLAEMSDEYYRSFAAHSIVQMLIVAGENDAAQDLLNNIEVDFIKEEATADFQSGREAMLAKLEAMA